MKIVYQDLIDCLSEKPSKELLSEKLFQLGHEHEIHGEIYHMEITPNRGDCLSVRGLARDLKTFFGQSQSMNIFEDDIKPLKIDFENKSPSDCPKISFLEIEIEETTDSYKAYLENYIKAIGNKKTNLFTDISNFISYELGQPTHCFDRDTIKHKLIFDNKECDASFETLLGSEINLKGKNCVFISNGKIISLAGVMGGASTACSAKTKRVLIECAYFNAESIIGKSIKYNLVSDAAHKFERGVDIASHELVLRRFIKVVQDHAKIKSIKLKSFNENKFQNVSIEIDINKVNNVLGTSLNRNICLEYLKDLSFNVSDKIIEVPSFRHDIKTNNDIAEEIARVIGYNNIENIPINLNKVSHENQESLGKLESFLINNGFTEVINFPFTSTQERKSIKIDNPLDSNRNTLRTSLKDSLIENLLYNERRQKESIKLFEISDIYTKDKESIQKKTLGIIASGRLGNNHNDFSKKIDFQYINSLLNKDLNENLFKIDEIQRANLETKKKDKIYYIEICLEDIPAWFFSGLSANDKSINFFKYKPVSEYPSSTRDFSFSIDDADKVDLVIKLLGEISDEIIKDSFIFDFYKNDKINMIKIGYRCIFQSDYKTLSDGEINLKVQEILKPLISIDGVSIPGM